MPHLRHHFNPLYLAVRVLGVRDPAAWRIRDFGRLFLAISRFRDIEVSTLSISKLRDFEALCLRGSAFRGFGASRSLCPNEAISRCPRDPEILRSRGVYTPGCLDFEISRSRRFEISLFGRP